MKWRKRPEIVEPIQLRLETWKKICDLADVTINSLEIGLDIPTSNGTVHAVEFDYVWKDVAGELHVCKPDIFEQTYEKVE